MAAVNPGEAQVQLLLVLRPPAAMQAQVHDMSKQV